MATGVLFVVKADSTPAPVARRVIRTLQDADANVIGVALNQLDFNKADRYYGAYTGYSKEYGKYYSEKQVQAS
jgi:Mrp family chromosome partitioning ATPase